MTIGLSDFRKIIGFRLPSNETTSNVIVNSTDFIEYGRRKFLDCTLNDSQCRLENSIILLI